MKHAGAVRFAGLILTALASLLALAPPAHAVETQVAFDPAGRIQRVDERFARQLGLFVDRYPGFQEARLFAVDDSSFVLEISMIRGGQLVREREPLTAAQADSLRQEVTRRAGEVGPPAEKPNQDGRSVLVGGYTLLGFGFYGWALPSTFDASDASVWVGSYFVTTGASFFVPLLMTQNAPVTWGMSNLSLYGATRGAWHGWLMCELAQSETDSWDEAQRRLGVMVFTSVAEGAIGYGAARASHMGAGTAQTIATGGDYGLLWGYLASDLALGGIANGRRTTAGVALASTAAGMAGGRLLAARRAYSDGDAAVMRSAGYVGVLFGAAIADAGDPQDFRPYSAGLIAGSVAGLIVGDRLVAGRDFSSGEGKLIQLGGSAGALTGLGIGVLVDGQGSSSSAVQWFGTAIGGALGYALSYGTMRNGAAARAAERTSWRFEIEPAGVLAAINSAPDSPGAERARRARPTPVLARLRLDF